MIIPMITEGTWHLRSETDPRWDSSGRGKTVGVSMPPECAARIEELKRLLGEPPDDLTWEYWKN